LSDDQQKDPAAKKPPWVWVWEKLRGRSRRSLDRIQRDLTVGRYERRKYAGDPMQPEHYRVKTRNE